MLTDKQQSLVLKVTEELQHKPWFKGVCLDNLPTDKEIDRDGEDVWIAQLTLDTEYWDNPNIFNIL